MTMPPPYVASDDASLVAGCLVGDEDALATLLERHGLVAELALLRGLEASTDVHAALAGRRTELMSALAKEGGSGLGGYQPGACSLRAYLAVVARRVAREPGAPPRAPFAPAPPTPQALQRDSLVDARASLEHIARVTELLDRQPPDVTALVRLRAHGVERAHAAALLGTAEATGRSVLSRLASRLSEADVGHEDAAAAGWRMALDAASYAERVEIALLTERDEGRPAEATLRGARARVEGTFRAVRDRLLRETTPHSVHCLDTRSIAGFVDGTMRGGARARVEGHALACTLCLDEVAALALDMRAVEAIRHAASGDSSLGLAAALLASGRYLLAAKLGATDPAPRATARLDLVARLAHAARSLESGLTVREHEASGVLMRGLPSDEEAPIVAFEALALDDTAGADRALDETTARSSVGVRLRMLTAASAGDLALARALASEARASVDPGAVADAESLLALPDGASLPREILVERLRDAVPALVRAALSIR